jgi:two-component system, OmpR family, heavy metal sensor histidine kinase CusS
MKSGFNPSFRFAIAIWTLVLAGGVLLAFGASTYFLVNKQKVELLDTQIKAFANRLPANPFGRGGVQRLEQSREWIFGSLAVHLQILDAEGSLIFQSPDWPLLIPISNSQDTIQTEIGGESERSTYPLRERGPASGYGRSFTLDGRWSFANIRCDEGRWRLGVLVTGDGRYHVLTSLAEIDRDMQVLLGRLLMVFLLALALLALGAWLIATRALRPLHNITQAAEKIVKGSFSERITPAEKAPEIDRIILLLNQMLDRLEAGYLQALRFSADASHELKTPLTLMQNSLLGHLESVPVESREAEFCTAMLEHLDRLKRVSRGLLLLAKVDAGQLPKASERFDLASLCRDLCDDAKALATDTDLQDFTINLPDSLTLESDPVLVRTIVFNLLVNAVHYSDRPIAIRVELKSDAEWIFLNIANKAPLIPEADQARLFDRFYRGSTRRIISDKDEAGSGLGLAISRELARLLGGDLQLREAGGDWVRFELRLPFAASEK